jgi:hypothetical protein
LEFTQCRPGAPARRQRRSVIVSRCTGTSRSKAGPLADSESASILDHPDLIPAAPGPQRLHRHIPSGSGQPRPVDACCGDGPGGSESKSATSPVGGSRAYGPAGSPPRPRRGKADGCCCCSSRPSRIRARTAGTSRHSSRDFPSFGADGPRHTRQQADAIICGGGGQHTHAPVGRQCPSPHRCGSGGIEMRADPADCRCDGRRPRQPP